MVSPGVLQIPEVKRWLAGVEPAWTLLELDSLMALRKEPSAENRALRLAANLMNQDLLGSSITRNAVVLLDAAVKARGLKLTATGNLARSVVEEMRQSFEWPGHDKASAFALHKVVNEPDFMPLFFIRTTMQKAGLLQRRKGKLLPTNSSPKVNRARCKRFCSTSLAGDWTFRISAGGFSVPGRSPIWASSSGRSRRRHPIGGRRKNCHACARSRTRRFSKIQVGTAAPSRSRRESCNR
jgi:hypothetical protein